MLADVLVADGKPVSALRIRGVARCQLLRDRKRPLKGGKRVIVSVQADERFAEVLVTDG